MIKLKIKNKIYQITIQKLFSLKKIEQKSYEKRE